MQPEARFLFSYCERAGNTAFWAEPFNALTNAAFLVAAMLALWLWLRDQRRDGALLTLSILMTLIGWGSFAFHTVPNRTTVLMDVLPIQAFILLYVGLALRRFLGASMLVACLGPLVFFAASAGLVDIAGSRALRGGIGYVPALLALFGFGLALLLRARGRFGLSPDAGQAVRPGLWGEGAARAARGLLIAGVVFTLSLTFRTLDIPACGRFPFGLHFAWHLLNAIVLGILAVVMGRARKNMA